MNTCEEVFSGRLDTPYHHKSPFAEERGRYLAHLLARGWVRATVYGTAAKLAAFAARVDINCESGVTVAQIGAAADDWMKEPRHYFRRDIGPRKARTKFVSDATNWLRFLGRLESVARAVNMCRRQDEKSHQHSATKAKLRRLTFPVI